MHALKHLLVASPLIIAGCASQPSLPPPEYPGIEQSDKIVIRDQRPSSESEKKIFSLLVTSSAYAIYRMPDTATKPTGTRLLAHRAYEKFPELGTQPSINVHHFVTYANMQSQLRKSSLLAGLTGPVGVAILSSQELPVGDVLTTRVDSSLFEKTAGDEEYTRAFFSAEENPEKSPVNLIYIDAEILGQRVASRCLVPPIKDKPRLFLIEAIDMCITNHLALYRTDSVKETAAKQADTEATTRPFPALRTVSITTRDASMHYPIRQSPSFRVRTVQPSRQPHLSQPYFGLCLNGPSKPFAPAQDPICR